MNIKKITTGYVVQLFNTDNNKFVYQMFVSNNEVEYIDELNSEPVNGDLVTAYLPFDMIQPDSGCKNENRRT